MRRAFSSLRLMQRRRLASECARLRGSKQPATTEVISYGDLAPLVEAAHHQRAPRTRGGQPLPIALPPGKPHESALDRLQHLVNQDDLGEELAPRAQALRALREMREATQQMDVLHAQQLACIEEVEHALMQAQAPPDQPPSAAALSAVCTRASMVNGKTIALGNDAKGNAVLTLVHPTTGAVFDLVGKQIVDTGASVTAASPDVEVVNRLTGEVSTLRAQFGQVVLDSQWAVQTAGGTSSIVTKAGALNVQLGDRQQRNAQTSHCAK